MNISFYEYVFVILAMAGIVSSFRFRICADKAFEERRSLYRKNYDMSFMKYERHVWKLFFGMNPKSQYPKLHPQGL